MGKPFAAVLRLGPEGKVEFDFGQDKQKENGGSAPVDFSGQEPLGKCPNCGSHVFESAMAYTCEKAVGPNRSCDFRAGKIILQRPIEKEQIRKLLETGKTDLLDRFVSKKGRPFKAYLVLKDKSVGFEFEPRQPRTKAGKGEQKKTEPIKVDFNGKLAVGKCPRCSGTVFQTDHGYLCEKSQAEKRPCKFKISRAILQQEIEAQQASKLLSEERRSDLLTRFISKAGRPFSAFLVMDEAGKVTFDFPPRDDSRGGSGAS
jgi:hypothetical protein